MATSIFGKDRYKVRGDEKYISDRAFYIVMSLVLLFGFVVNALEVYFLADIVLTWDPIIFVVVYFVMAIVGVLINVFSRNTVLSFIGYCLVVLPIGALLAFVVPAYSINVVRAAFFATVCLSAVFVLLAILYPNVFLSIWKVLSVSLLIGLIFSLVNMLTGIFSTAMVWLDWLIVLVFCCYVGFDISLARNRPKTIDNAIDSACGLYLDLINIFVRLLAILGRRD